MDVEFVRNRFIKHFDGETGNIYFSSGRINLVDEHTDYNGGFVFPGAVDKGIMAEVRPDGANAVMCYSIDLKNRIEFKVDDPEGPRAVWTCFVYGMVQEFRALSVDVRGFNTTFTGSVPLGASMSSSTAMKSHFGCVLNDLFADNKISKWDIVLVGQTTEHKYIDMNRGIVDQFVNVFDQEGKLMCLGCRSREFEYFPLDPQGYKLVLVDSKVKHGLVGSPYNGRRRGCENVIAAVTKQFPNKKFEALRGVNEEELEAVRDRVNAENYQRAHFVLDERGRILAVCDALVANGYETVGRKICETRRGLSKEYEVNCEELDFLNDVAKENGVTDSRIMGSGFGGCTIDLAKDELYDKFIANTTKKFTAKYGHTSEIYPVIISEGSHKVY